MWIHVRFLTIVTQFMQYFVLFPCCFVSFLFLFFSTCFLQELFLCGFPSTFYCLISMFLPFFSLALSWSSQAHIEAVRSRCLTRCFHNSPTFHHVHFQHFHQKGFYFKWFVYLSTSLWPKLFSSSFSSQQCFPRSRLRQPPVTALASSSSPQS